VDVRGCYAYVIDLGGLRVISISDPTNPVEVGGCDIPVYPYGVAVNGDYAFVTHGDSGTVYAVSVSDPAHPNKVGRYDLTEQARRLTAVGNYIYVANTKAGLQILQFYGAGVEESHKPQAIGRKPAATVMRSLSPGFVAFDAMGRKVLSPKPGVYFVREAQAQAVRKVVIQR
jgi:hypothetical protein